MKNPSLSAENSQMVSFSDRSEIAFFDVETSVPNRPGQGYAILEFGAILVCPKKLIELESYSTLLQPSDLSLISNLSVRCNGISRDAVVSAPTFGEIADKVYDILHGRIWAGHNILRFDCYRIREAFAGINRPAPEPKGTIDSLVLLTQRFGRRAGDMKMATLASYFGIGQQTHRSLDDVRMNLEVLKYCATVLFLESSLPNIFTENSWVSPNATTRSRSNGRTSLEEMSFDSKRAPSTSKVEDHATSAPLNHIEEAHPIFSLVTPMSNVNNTPGTVESCFAGTEPLDMGQMAGEMERQPLGSEDSMEEEESGTASRESCVTTAENDSREEEAHPILSLVTSMMSTNTPDIVESNFSRPDAFDMGLLTSEMERQPIQSEPLQSEDCMKEEKSVLVPQEYSVTTSSEGSTGRVNFLAPYEISLPSISVILAPFYRGTQKIQILHNSVALQVCCRQLKVRFGISTKFVNNAGHPRLSFVVDASPSLCRILDKIDGLAQQLSVDSGSSSEWRPSVTRKAGFFNFPTVRLHLPTIMDGDMLRWATEIYQEESSTTQRLVFSKFDIIELDSLFTPGNSLDAYFSLDAYDYHQNAGIRLVAKKLILHPN